MHLPGFTRKHNYRKRKKSLRAVFFFFKKKINIIFIKYFPNWSACVLEAHSCVWWISEVVPLYFSSIHHCSTKETLHNTYLHYFLLALFERTTYELSIIYHTSYEVDYWNCLRLYLPQHLLTLTQLEISAERKWHPYLQLLYNKHLFSLCA